MMASSMCLGGEEEVAGQLREIRQEMEILKAGQASLLEGQKRLSEEHKQIRYRIHRKG